MTEEEMQARIVELEADLTKAETEKKNALGEKFKATNDLKDIQDAKEAAEEAVMRAKGDIDALEKRLTAKFQRELDAVTSERDTLSADLKTIRVDSEITKALAEGNVLDYQLEPLTYMFKAKSTYENGAATIDGKPIGEFISEYLGSETGSNYVRAANNSGSGSTGNSSTVIPADHGFTKENFNSKQGEWMVLAGTDPVTAKQAAIDAGRADLASTL